MVLLMIAVIGAIYGGIASASEAAALGVMGSLVIVLAQRTMSFVPFNRSVSRAIRATVMIVLVLLLAFPSITLVLPELMSR
jgi:C4-dicarboxylate transporter, DctM subunit